MGSLIGQLEGKGAVITGAGSGMGKATALLFAQQGATVICADISGAESGTAKAIGDLAIAVRADVSKTDDVVRMIDIAEKEWGGVDVVFNNAGWGGPIKALADTDEEEFDQLVAVNLRGAFLGMKYGIRAMLRQGGGAIVNTASAVALTGYAGLAAYSGSKAGIVQMTKSAALDYARSGIRINAICPGMTWTGMSLASDEQPVPPSGATAAQPMGRWGLADEIAATALFLASEQSSFITGAAIPADGGMAAGRNLPMPSFPTDPSGPGHG